MQYLRSERGRTPSAAPRTAAAFFEAGRDRYGTRFTVRFAFGPPLVSDGPKSVVTSGYGNAKTLAGSTIGRLTDTLLMSTVPNEVKFQNAVADVVSWISSCVSAGV